MYTSGIIGMLSVAMYIRVCIYAKILHPSWPQPILVQASTSFIQGGILERFVEGEEHND
jgi:hypothetical protein